MDPLDWPAWRICGLVFKSSLVMFAVVLHVILARCGWVKSVMPRLADGRIFMHS